MRPVRLILVALVALSPSLLAASPAAVSFSQSAAQIDRFDFVEIAATVQSPDSRNPFEDATLTGTLETADGSRHWSVDGFCDAARTAVKPSIEEVARKVNRTPKAIRNMLKRKSPKLARDPVRSLFRLKALQVRCGSEKRRSSKKREELRLIPHGSAPAHSLNLVAN
jgi:hypothetical protein